MTEMPQVTTHARHPARDLLTDLELAAHAAPPSAVGFGQALLQLGGTGIP